LCVAVYGAEKSYQAACVADSSDSFLLHVSAAARHAKRTRQILQDLTIFNYAGIAITREMIFEARGIENVLTRRATHSGDDEQRVAPRAAPVTDVHVRVSATHGVRGFGRGWKKRAAGGRKRRGRFDAGACGAFVQRRKHGRR
jgi:hypothetical protein